MNTTKLITPKTKEELAADYECSPRTISRMCKEIGIVTRKRLTTLEVLKFYENFGLPVIGVDILKDDNVFSTSTCKIL